MRRPVLGTLFALACVSILCSPSTSSAIPIHRHITVERVIGHEADGPLTIPRETVRIIDVAPPDSDDDGCPDTDDSYNGPGCEPPPPPPDPIESVQPASTVTTYSTGGYSIPSYIVACESGGDYSAQNASGAYGAYQIMPGTASAYGCDLSTASGQDQCAAEIYADVGSSAWSCG